MTASQDFQFTSSNGTFVLYPITADHAGVYLCEANNGVGNPISKNFSIAVEGINLYLSKKMKPKEDKYFLNGILFLFCVSFKMMRTFI